MSMRYPVFIRSLLSRTAAIAVTRATPWQSSGKGAEPVYYFAPRGSGCRSIAPSNVNYIQRNIENRSMFGAAALFEAMDGWQASSEFRRPADSADHTQGLC